MSEVPQDLRYTEEHEYVRETDVEDEVVVGITDYAQSELGDVVYVELPSEEDAFERMDVFGTIEAVKAVSDLYCPLTGTVVEVNDELDADPAQVNDDPYGGGWMIRLRMDAPSELDELMSASEYRSHLEAGG